MWKRGGRSDALDRAQALLSARRTGRGGAGSSQGSPGRRSAHPTSSDGRVETRSAPANNHRLFSDLSDVSSVSSCSEPGEDVSESAHRKPEGHDGHLVTGPGTQSCLGGRGRSRFLKKPPPPAVDSGQSAVRTPTEQVPDIRHPPSAQRGSRAAEEHVGRGSAPLPSQRSGEKQKCLLTSRAAVDSSKTPGGLRRDSLRGISSVSLDSDEEDMKKLLQDTLDSPKTNFEKASSRKSSHETFSGGGERVVQPSDTAPPCSPASPRHCRSPFRFAGHSQARFSSSLLSPSPSPTPTARSASGHKVVSLEELFPVGLDDTNTVSSASDFGLNVMTLDDLHPVFTQDPPGMEGIRRSVIPGSPKTLRPREGAAEEYQSDFESVSGSEPDHRASHLSEDLPGDGGVESVSEVPEETLEPHVSQEERADEHSSTLSDASGSWCSGTSDRGGTSHGSRSSGSPTDRRPSSDRRLRKDATVQTQTEPRAWWSDGTIYMKCTPPTAHMMGSDTVEALSSFKPAACALHEMLKQHVTMTQRFIESSSRLHSSVVQSLEPPNHRYVTLKDTMEYIHKLTSKDDSRGRTCEGRVTRDVPLCSSF